MTDKTKMIIPAKPANAAKTANACGAPAARARRGVVAAELTAAELRTAAREIAAADIANGTRGNYERECRKFTDFAAGREFTCELFAAYITALSAGGAKPAALQLAASSVRHYCRECERADITDFPLTKKLLRGARRLYAKTGVPQQQHSAPLSADMIAVAAANAAAEKTAIGLRDIALLRVAFNALLRRSEIINLRRGDFIVADDGAAYLTAARAKTIDGGERNPLLLGAQTAKAISEWMAISAAAGITDNAAPLFCGIKKGGKITGAKLSPNGVHRIFARRTDGKCSPHGSRIGGAQYLAERNTGIDAIARRGSWKSPQMAIRYTLKMAEKNCPAAAAMAAM